jgi:hypothetical protein
LPSAFSTVLEAHRSSTVAASADSDDAAVGVVIVDHGSKKKASNDMLFEFVDVYKCDKLLFLFDDIISTFQ